MKGPSNIPSDSRHSRFLPLAIWLSSNFLFRLSFFIFKYSGVFYLFHLVASQREARLQFSWIFGAAYLLPVLWSVKIQTVRAQRRAVLFGGLLLALSFVSLGNLASPLTSGTLFAVGFGLLNPNFKAAFASALKIDTHPASAHFTILHLVTNISAALAGFLASKPMEQGLARVQELYVLCGVGLVCATVAWFTLTSREKLTCEATSQSRVEGTPETNVSYRFVALIVVIILVTFFWTAFELRPMALSQLANERLCEMTGGLRITPVQLQSVNPIAYSILSPIAAVLLCRLGDRVPHPLYSMGSGVALMGIGFLAFSHLVNSSPSECLSAVWFVTLYLIQTCAEILVEPIGASLISVNSPSRFRSILFVLWECNSGIAYLIGGLISPANLTTVGEVGVVSGVLLILATPILRRYVV